MTAPAGDLLARQKSPKARIQWSIGVWTVERLERLDPPLDQIEQSAAESVDEIRLVRHRDDAQATRRAKARDGLNHEKRVRWSSADVGSSRRSACGSRSSARAIVTRCFSPPESVAASRSRSFDSSPTSSSVAASRSSEKSPGTSRADAEIIADRSFEHHRRLHDKRDATPELTENEDRMSRPSNRTVPDDGRRDG